MRSPSYAWGCSLLIIKTRLATLVCPTHMGIYLHPEQLRKLHLRLPHMRGDLPGLYTGSLNGFPATHMRGDLLALRRSTLTRNWAAPPLCVGMYPSRSSLGVPTIQLPHMRGDLPDLWKEAVEKAGPAPRAWGCTRRSGIHSLQLPTRPANAGMYLCCTPPTRR